MSTTRTVELLQLAGRVSSASVADAMAARHDHRFHLLDLASPSPELLLFGPAATMRLFPRRPDLERPELGDFAAALHAAVGDEAEGRVLVIAAGDGPDAAVAGGKKLTRVAALKMAGVLTDARLRDFAEIIELGLVAYCRGETILADRSELMPFEAGVPVAVDGVAVAPGDWIYGDGSGVVVIPAGEVREILDAALEREEADAAEAARIRAEYGVEDEDLDLEE